ncbi:MAG: hypothetical protein J6T16_03310 [Opitutales bacterium]|nr:hypothetical protein [Opitutales bacterium]
MNILYILGNGSTWDNGELRYSLRSIATFGRNVEKIFLIGEKPYFVSNKVFYEPYAQKKQPKHKNMVELISRAIEAFGSDLGEHFLLSSDDHFYVKETDFANYPHFKKGELPREISSGIYGDEAYTKSLVDTRRFLEILGRPTGNYAQHCNTHIHADVWRETKKYLDIAAMFSNGVEPTAFHYNFLEGAEFIKRKDCKIRSAAGRQDLLAQIGDRDCFSIYDSAIQGGVGAFLAEAFPHRCVWER